SYGKVLAGAMCLARELRPALKDDAMVGVWLPPSAPAAIVNIALALLGKTAVNLNYTASPDLVQSAAKQCGLRNILTSRRFTQRVKLDAGPGVEIIFLEDLAARISGFRKVAAYLTVVLVPGIVLERWVLNLRGHKPTDLATVIFSSGST